MSHPRRMKTPTLSVKLLEQLEGVRRLTGFNRFYMVFYGFMLFYGLFLGLLWALSWVFLGVFLWNLWNLETSLVTLQ